MAELANAPSLSLGVERLTGSSPVRRTIIENLYRERHIKMSYAYVVVNKDNKYLLVENDNYVEKVRWIERLHWADLFETERAAYNRVSGLNLEPFDVKKVCLTIVDKE